MFNNSVKLKWQGKEYTCPINFELTNSMELDGINILQYWILFNKGTVPPASLIARIYSWVLSSGGCIVSAEDIYESIMKDVEGSINLLQAGKSALNWFFPEIEDDGDSAPAKADSVKKG